MLFSQILMFVLEINIMALIVDSFTLQNSKVWLRDRGNDWTTYHFSDVQIPEAAAQQNLTTIAAAHWISKENIQFSRILLKKPWKPIKFQFLNYIFELLY